MSEKDWQQEIPKISGWYFVTTVHVPKAGDTAPLLIHLGDDGMSIKPWDLRQTELVMQVFKNRKLWWGPVEVPE